MACGRGPRSDPAHLRSVGAGGGDELTNLIPLCRRCHSEQHRTGIRTFVQKYNLPVEWETTGWAKRGDLT